MQHCFSFHCNNINNNNNNVNNKLLKLFFFSTSFHLTFMWSVNVNGMRSSCVLPRGSSVSSSVRPGEENSERYDVVFTPVKYLNIQTRIKLCSVSPGRRPLQVVSAKTQQTVVAQMSWLSTRGAQRASQLRRHAQFVPRFVLVWNQRGGATRSSAGVPLVVYSQSDCVFTVWLCDGLPSSLSQAPRRHKHAHLQQFLRQFRQKDPTQTHNNTTERCCSRLKHTRA